MSEFYYDSMEEFEAEWKPDNLNIPIKAYYDRSERTFNVEFAQPRKLSMAGVYVKDVRPLVAQLWVDKYKKTDPLELEFL